MQQWPTVDDLRVKECYICREEETYDKPARPSKRWVHPCKCTLIAHEDCLLEWIRTSENNPDKPLLLILKCPQCGERYRLESENPLVLRVLDLGNRALQRCGTVVTALTVVTGVSAVGTGVYIVSAGYGAYAVRHFLGQELYDLILGEDIDKWPLSAFFTLPLIPFSLILSKTKRFRDALPLATLMSIWPSIPRLSGAPNQERGFLSFLGLGPPTRDQPRIKYPASVNKISSDLFRDLLFSWPPSPFVFTIGLRYVRSTYGIFMDRYRQSILGDATQDPGGPEDREGLLDNFQMEIRIEEGEDDDNEEPRAPQQRPAAAAAANNQADQLQDDNNVRLILDDTEEGPAPAEERPAEPAQAPVRVEPREQQQNLVQNPNGPAEAILEGRARQVGQPPQNQNGDQREGGNAAARVRLQMTTVYVGSVVGSALIVPPLASFAGSVLLRLALPNVPNAHYTLNFKGYSPFSPRRLLCRFLGVRPPGSAPGYPMMRMYSFSEDMSAGEVIRATTLLSCRALVVGTPAWTESDPVWWRNAIGIGLFYVAKDLISIWYQYLSRREIRSRRVKDRAFEGINPAELDLKPGAREAFQITTLTPNSMAPHT